MFDIGPTSPDEKTKLISKSINDAEESGKSSEGKKKLTKLLSEFDNVLRVRLVNDPPAKVPAMKVRLDENARPVMARPRKYSHGQRKFIENSVNRLEEYGMARPIFDASWASAPFLYRNRHHRNFDWLSICDQLIRQLCPKFGPCLT